MKVLGFDNVFLPVGDLAQAVDFYTGALGLSIAKRFDGIGTVLFRVGNETPGLGVAETNDPHSGAQKVWFEVEDAKAAADELIAAGVTPIRPPFQIPTGWAVEVTDPWGNIIGLTDYTGNPNSAAVETTAPGWTRHRSAGTTRVHNHRDQMWQPRGR